MLGIISAVWYEKQVLRHAETEELTMLEQRNCIDSVCNLLTEKEQQMAVVLDLLENMPDVGEIVNRKIPAIVGQTEEQPSPEAATTIEPPATGNKKRNLWSFFKKKGKKIGLCPAKGENGNCRENTGRRYTTPHISKPAVFP
ncbi:MAG: hypothetical protein ACLTT9_00075 [Phocaeicola vulgatus]